MHLAKVNNGKHSANEEHSEGVQTTGHQPAFAQVDAHQQKQTSPTVDCEANQSMACMLMPSAAYSMMHNVLIARHGSNPSKTRQRIMSHIPALWNQLEQPTPPSSE